MEKRLARIIKIAFVNLFTNKTNQSLENYNKKKPTVQDIANEVSISASTVSRALNNHPKISQKTKELVWDASKKLGYQPNIPAYMDSDKAKPFVLWFLI